MFGPRMSEKDGFQARSIARKTPLHVDYCPETPLSLRTPAGTRPGSDDQSRDQTAEKYHPKYLSHGLIIGERQGFESATRWLAYCWVSWVTPGRMVQLAAR